MKNVRYLLSHLKPYKIKIVLAVVSGILKELSVIAAVGICAYMAAVAGIGNMPIQKIFCHTMWLIIFWLTFE